MMKYVFVGLIIALNYFAPAQATKNTIAVGFYNVENFYDTINDPLKNDDEFTPTGAISYTPAVFFKKIENLSEVISQMGTDKAPEGLSLLGVAEVENEAVLKALCASERLRKRNWKVVHFEGPDERSVDCALLYNPTHFRVLGAVSLTVPVESGDRPTRDVLYVHGKLFGDPVHVFVNHWPSRRGGEAITREKRKTAAGVSKRIIDSLMKENPLTKVIVMGDLNDDPINESITKVLGAKWKQEDVKKGGLFNPWTTYYKKGLGTIAFQDSWGLFDQIIISYGFLKRADSGLRYLGEEVFNRPFMIEKFGNYRGYPKRAYSNSAWNDGYSDHFPTIVYFLKQEPPPANRPEK